MERRRHPTYVRGTAAVSFGLFAAGLACLVVGFAVRGTAWRNFETILNLGFCASVGALLFHWFTQGETTVCPECGRRLRANPDRDPAESLKFPCSDCRIEWDTGGSHDM